MLIKQASQILQRTPTHIRRMAKAGHLRWHRLDSGRIDYFDEDVYALAGSINSKRPAARLCVTYYRVSGRSVESRERMAIQQELVDQWCMSRGLSIDRSYEDWAHSSEWSLDGRPGLWALLRDAMAGRIRWLVVESPSRLARFGIEFIEGLLMHYGVELFYLNRGEERPVYLDERQGDIMNLIKGVVVKRLGDLGEALPQPPAREKRPGRLISANGKVTVRRRKGPAEGDGLADLV